MLYISKGNLFLLYTLYYVQLENKVNLVRTVWVNYRQSSSQIVYF